MRNKLSALQFQDKIFIAYGLVFLVMFGVVFGSTRLLIWLAFRGEIDTYVETLQGKISNNYQFLLNKVQKDVRATAADERLHAFIAGGESAFGYRPAPAFDLFEYGTPDGRLLYPASEAGRSRPIALESESRKAQIVLRYVPQQPDLGRLFVVQVTESGGWGFFTGGYVLQTWLETTQTSIQSDEHPVFLVRKSDTAAGPVLEMETAERATEDWLPLNNAARNVPLAAREVLMEGSEAAYTASQIEPFNSALATTREGSPVDLVVAYSHARQMEWQRQLTLILFLSGIVGLALVYLISYIISRRITRPIATLRQGVSHIAAGNLDHRVEIQSRNEVGQLAEGFNQMARDLKLSLEERMAAERAATWRDAARQVAHEIKNPLFPIRLSVENLQQAKSNPDVFEQIFTECTDTVIEEVDRIGKLIDEFHQFARMPNPQRRLSQLNDVVRSVLSLYVGQHVSDAETDEIAQPESVESELPDATFWMENISKISVETQLTPLPLLFIDPEQIAQVLGNLLKNAIEAMPDGGKLHVKTAFTPNTPSRATESVSDEEAVGDGTVSLEIRDTGHGMSEETMSNLFMPYYTTKSETADRGLGMSIVRRIVTEHGGEIDFQSREGVGTTFRVCFPHNPGSRSEESSWNTEGLAAYTDLVEEFGSDRSDAGRVDERYGT